MASEERSDNTGGGDEDERTNYVYEKLQGKWLVEDEPSLKRKKVSGSSHHEEGGVNIGGPALPRRRRMVVSDSSNDNGAMVAPTPTTETPPSASRTRVEMRGTRRAREAIATLPETTWATPMVVARATSQVPKPAWGTLVVATKAIGPRTSETIGDCTTG